EAIGSHPEAIGSHSEAIGSHPEAIGSHSEATRMPVGSHRKPLGSHSEAIGSHPDATRKPSEAFGRDIKDPRESYLCVNYYLLTNINILHYTIRVVLYRITVYTLTDNSHRVNKQTSNKAMT